MKRHDCNLQIGRIRLIVLIAIIGTVVAGLLLARHWSAPRVVERQQAALILAIERRSAKRLERLLAPSYRDQWDFDRDQAGLALTDLGGQFFVLTLKPIDSRIEMGTDGSAEVRVRIEVDGRGSPIAQEVIRTANRLKTPFVFRWRRQSLWPGDWQLIGIENPDLPKELYGYRPGDLRRALEGEF